MISPENYDDGSYDEPDYYLPETNDVDINKNILKYSNVSGRVLVWDFAGGGGGGNYVFNGGQLGNIDIGSTDGGVISIGDVNSSGLINIGSNANTDSIHINGGLEYQFDQVSVPNSLPDTFDLDSNHYIVEIMTPAIVNVKMPSCGGISGRMYIVILGHLPVGGYQLNLQPDGGDTIIGEPNEFLNVKGQTIKLMSDGISNWLIV